MATIQAIIHCEDQAPQPLEFNSTESFAKYLHMWWTLSSGIKFVINGHTFYPDYQDEEYMFLNETIYKILQVV